MVLMMDLLESLSSLNEVVGFRFGVCIGGAANGVRTGMETSETP